MLFMIKSHSSVHWTSKINMYVFKCSLKVGMNAKMEKKGKLTEEMSTSPRGARPRTADLQCW